ASPTSRWPSGTPLSSDRHLVRPRIRLATVVDHVVRGLVVTAIHAATDRARVAPRLLRIGRCVHNLAPPRYAEGPTPGIPNLPSLDDQARATGATCSRVRPARPARPSPRRRRP